MIKDIGADEDFKLKITTLPVLRGELKLYKHFATEKENIKKEYALGVKNVNDPITKLDSQLYKISTPSPSDDNELPSITKNDVKDIPQTKEGKYNNLIYRKQKAEKEKREWLEKHTTEYLVNIAYIDARINAVEHMLNKMTEENRNFIEDLYINNISFKDVKEKYNIKNDGDISRKATNILKKLV